MNVKVGRCVMALGVCAALLCAVPGCVSGAAEFADESVITVEAVGSVMARPDMIQMVISLSHIASTTREAQETVNARVREALAILSDAGIADADISTASLRFSPEYEWTTARVLVGQKAEQILSFTVSDISAGDAKISGIIDRLISINGIELQSFNFGVKESAALYVRSRELAFQKAREKADQYAELSGLVVVQTLSVSEGEYAQVFASNAARNSAVAQADMAGGASGSVVPSGEVEISTTISVSFLAK